MTQRRGARLDPRALLLVALCYSALAVAFSDLRDLALLVAAGVFVARLAGGRPWQVFVSIRGLAAMVAAVALAQSMFARSGDPLLSVGDITVLTVDGLGDGATFLLRATAVLVSGAMLSASNPGRLSAALERLRIPSDIVFMTAIGLRFLPMLRRDAADLQAALQLRGAGARIPAPFRGFPLLAGVLTPLVKRTLRRAHTVSLAAEMRAYRLHASRTQREALRFTYTDTAVSLLAVGAAAALIALRM
ncbi:MAG: hypothetical protein GF331_21210 [Chitinivibrionales bacterium]|nr:hypothetical protein [Chitinivibrionales bacterium]